jgi:hemerythrin superfamily protein
MFVRPENRADAFCQLVSELVQHEVAEEMVVYPAVRVATGDDKAAVEARLHEQSQAEKMLDQMEALDPASLEFTAALTELSISVINHAEAEERRVFPLLRAAEQPDSLFQLAARYEKAKQKSPTHPHPHAPDTPPANKVLGPITGLFDRARDAVRRL